MEVDVTVKTYLSRELQVFWLTGCYITMPQTILFHVMYIYL